MYLAQHGDQGGGHGDSKHAPGGGKTRRQLAVVAPLPDYRRTFQRFPLHRLTQSGPRQR